MGVFNHNTGVFLGTWVPRQYPGMWDFSHVEAGSLVSPLLKKRDFALRIGCFVPGMWLLRRHTVCFSSWRHRFCRVLMGSMTTKHDLSGGMARGSCGTLSSGLWVGCRSDSGRTSLGVLWDLNVGSSYCLSWNTWSIGSWEILPVALFWAAFSSANWQLFGGVGVVCCEPEWFPKQTYMDFI